MKSILNQMSGEEVAKRFEDGEAMAVRLFGQNNMWINRVVSLSLTLSDEYWEIAKQLPKEKLMNAI